MKKMRRKEFKIPEILVMRMILSFGFLFGSLITLNASPNFGQNVLTTQKKNVSTESEYSKSVAPKSGEQTVTIRGKVLDASGQPLPGANISIVGTTTGVITDAEGYYNIAAKQGDVLKFSYIGYKEQQVQVAKKTSIDVVLTENLSTLEETVVVGMGKQRRASVVGAISTIAVNDLRVPTRSLTNALSGKVAGAVIVQRTGEIGNDDPSFWIRGISTFGSNRSPLILVDGVERSMDNIPVEEVESVSILKDASATAVYGVRAANGVVIVTTRKGVAQKPAVELKIEQGVSDLPGMPKFLDGANYATLYNEAYGHENYSPDYINNLQTKADPYLYPNVNWFNETYKKYSTNQQTTVNVRGGGEVARYFVSFGYLGEDGNLKNNPLADYKSNLNLKRYNFRSNVDITLNKTLELDIEAGGYLSDLHTPGLGNTIYSQYYSPAQELYYWSYLSTPISCPVKVPIGKDSNGNYIMGWGAPTQVGEKNPAERLFGSGYNTTYSNQLLSQVTLKQDLKKLLNGLKFQTSFSFDNYSQTNIRRTKAEATYGVQGRDATTGEIIVKQIDKGQQFLGYSNSVSTNRAEELKAQLVYDHLFGEKHRVGSMLMYYQRDYINGTAGTSILSLPYRKQGLAYRATYAYNDRYFTEFNCGYNGSENFPKENRFGLFPAVSGGWLISSEPFWKNMKDKINMLKIRGSWGLVGAEALPNGDRYGYLSVYGSNFGSYYFGEAGSAGSSTTTGGTGGTGVGQTRIGVNNLTWEKGLKKNIGFELKMFNDAISLEADYFHERRSDILIQRQILPDFVGMNAAPFANMGKMVNRGIDGTMELNKRYKDGGIKLYGNATFTSNKILEQDEPPRPYAYEMRTGQQYGQNFGLVALGYFTSQEDINNSPVQTFGGPVRPGDIKYKDINGDGKIDVNDQIPIGYSNIPELIYGFGVQGDYKGFDIGVFFRGQARVSYALGGSYIPFNQGVGKGNLFEQALDRWTVDNPSQSAQYPRLYNGTSSNNWQTSTKTLYNGSFLRLAEIEVGKDFNKEILSKVHLKGLRLYVHVSNAAIFSKWKMWDPETGTSGGGNYPLERKLNLGMRVNF